MNKENKTAAGLRRSAIAERIKLREEWSALKEIDSQNSQPARRQNKVLNKKQNNLKIAIKFTTVKEVTETPGSLTAGRLNRQSNKRLPSDALRGVVALVEVGNESRALPLRAALTALGASVMPAWSPLITHLVWGQGGCRSTRARARALASCLVSPLWVEACACASARLPERAFPAAARPSDLPSPTTLRQMLKKADAENIQFTDLLSDDKEKLPRLRISSETEQDTSADTSKDTSRDTSKNTSHDTSKNTSPDTSKDTTTGCRVNTAPRRALPRVSESVSPRSAAKPRRKLFTQREPDMTDSDDEDENSQLRPKVPKKQVKPNPVVTQRKKQTKKQVNAEPVVTQRERKELARAERMAKRFLAARTGIKLKPATERKTRIVLTGMCRNERREISAAILKLNGRIQKCVNKKTTHVLLGSFQQTKDYEQTGITGIINLSHEELIHRSDVQKARTVSALCGAARGARVLHAAWARDCAHSNKWIHEGPYVVQHLKKISQKARVERAALRKLRSDYAYDVFCGMRVFVTKSAEQRDAAIQLLTLCGAVVQNGRNQDGGIHGQGLTQRTQHALVTQNGEIRYGVVESNANDCDLKIGVDNGEVSSKWVFDSVAAARMRTTRRYVVSELSSQTSHVMQEIANFTLDDC